MPWEPVMEIGQKWLLTSLAQLPNWTVKVLAGTIEALHMYRVDRAGIYPTALFIRARDFRNAVHDWLNGGAWTDLGGSEVVEPNGALLEHTCGWAKVDEQWTCVQDYYAKGMAPETACGAIWTAAA